MEKQKVEDAFTLLHSVISGKLASSQSDEAGPSNPGPSAEPQYSGKPKGTNNVICKPTIIIKLICSKL